MIGFFKATKLTFSEVYKKDHTRTDFRKAQKMRPGIWYLILASAYLIITCWSLYFVCTMYAAVILTLCKSALFVDTVNVGYETDPTWVGMQRLGKQIYIFSQEATITQTNFRTVFEAHNDTVNGFPE